MSGAEAGLPAGGKQAAVIIDGPAGKLQGVVHTPVASPRGIAVICHPHPLFGGAMGNKVVYTLASAAREFGLIATRFNFRGVEASEGVHDGSRGETGDCLAVVDWLRAQAPGQPLLLAGFSFGAYVALKAAAIARPAGLVSIAPPFGRYFDEIAAPPHPGCPWMAIHSRDDDTVRYEDTRAMLASYEPAPELHSVDGAGHFFHGRLNEIRDATLGFLTQRWI